MARIRSIKPEFWKSESIACHDMFTRLVFIGLWTYVDDNGVGIDHWRLIAAELFPLEDDFARVSREVRESLARLSAAGRILRYTVEGKAYLAIANWSEHQRIDKPGKSRYPEPTDPRATPTPPASRANANPPEPEPETIAEPSRESRETPATGTEEQGNRGTGERELARLAPKSPAKRARGTRIPDDFQVTDAMVAWARERVPHVDGRLETEKFVNHWRSKTGKDATKLDWVATWRNWMLNARQSNVVAIRRPSTTDQRVQAALDLAAKYAEEDA